MQDVIFTTFEEGKGGTITSGIDHKPFTLHKLILPSEFQHEKVSLDIQEGYAKIWKSIDPTAQISLEPTIEEALKLARRIGDRGDGIQTFVTGDPQLIGSALCFLEPNYSDFD